MTPDIAVVGGGPAGLAVALEAARRGLSVAVFERREDPVDKACGEGLMPHGLAALERLGALAHLDRADAAPFDRIAYVQEDGRSAVGRLPAPGGLGVRRVALSRALAARAREAGVALHPRCAVRSHRIDDAGVSLETDAGPVRARLLVAADGLHSRLREAEGLSRPWVGPRRFGLRRHVALAPWSSAVEVHFAAGVEAYVTPAGRGRVGVAFLWEDGAVAPVSFDALLARFPALGRRVAGAPWDSSPRGAGPLGQAVSARVKRRFALVGDAAGYVDAITGEGLSLAFEGAAALGAVLPEALARGATAEALAPYERAAARAFRRYARLASLLVWTARRPRLRRAVVGGLSAWPWLFERALAAATAP
jgi:flavin-dependent dehydrogenase